eukprot:4988501-Pleurochrysis_carterae.AAC.3
MYRSVLSNLPSHPAACGESASDQRSRGSQLPVVPSRKHYAACPLRRVTEAGVDLCRVVSDVSYANFYQADLREAPMTVRTAAQSGGERTVQATCRNEFTEPCAPGYEARHEMRNFWSTRCMLSCDVLAFVLFRFRMRRSFPLLSIPLFTRA